MNLETSIPQSKGSYLLVFYLPKSKVITIGKLGQFLFQSGCYVYVGSALGPGGLAGRIKHHLSSNARPHWHIDYFKQHAVIIEIWYQEGKKDMEHVWAEQLKKLDFMSTPAKGFGSSDCSCDAHFFHIMVNAI